MKSLLAEVTNFELWQRAVRNQFREGESIGSLVLVVASLAGVVVIVLVLARLQSGWQKKSDPVAQQTNPQRLYIHLLCALGLTAAQRRLLEAVARGCDIAHPAALLISDALFDQYVAQWNRMGPADSDKLEERHALGTIRARLFPEGRGIVQSAAAPRPKLKG